MSSFETDLRKMIRDRKVVAVIGSGVSRATSSDAPMWRPLIQSAVERCRELGTSNAWCEVVLSSARPTKHRTPFIQPEIEDELFAYLATTCRSLNCPALKVGGTDDHVHLLRDRL